ncbi:MAG: hypothetical protein RQ743_09595, partial [Bacteroidales bacterium]|nr:hypothetical protein [Bacteroidales bacterium]
MSKGRNIRRLLLSTAWWMLAAFAVVGQSSAEITSPDVCICEDGNTEIRVDLTGTPSWSITYTDGTNTFTIDNIDSSPYFFSVSPLITTTYTLTEVSDDTGVPGTASGTVTITVDIIDPTASNPAPINVQCIGDVPAPDITVVTDEADNCTAAPVVAFVSDVSNGNTCPEVITRTYSVTDDCGNSILVTQTITVDDDINPTASNPAPINVQCIGDVPAPDITVVT